MTIGSDTYTSYYTFSGRAHLKTPSGDNYIKIEDCYGDSFCKTVKATPWLGGFALGLGLLVVFF